MIRATNKIIKSFPPMLVFIFLFVWWFAIPAINYNSGTSKNITVEVVAEPFVGSDKLVYRWSGDIVRSCAVELRRTIIDSDNVVTRLTPKSYRKIPYDELGHAAYEITVTVPIRLAEGPAIYSVVEVPTCSWMHWVAPVGIRYPDVNFVVTRNEK